MTTGSPIDPSTPGSPPSGERSLQEWLDLEAREEKLRDAAGSQESLIAELIAVKSDLFRVSSALEAAEAEVKQLRGTKSSPESMTQAMKRRVAHYVKSPNSVAPVIEDLQAEPVVDLSTIDPGADPRADPRYVEWTKRYDTMNDERRSQLKRQLASTSGLPAIAVILPIFNTPERYLREAIESVRSQIYQDWELCIVDDCSTDPWIASTLAEFEDDARIKVIRLEQNGHISRASNAAIDLASSPWIALFDHDDLLAEHALAHVALSAAQHPDAVLIYSDEDHIDDLGHRAEPYFKPDFDPLLLLGQNCVSHLSVLRTERVKAVGGFREGLEGSQDWDLILRVAQGVDLSQIVHIPHVLYHWRVHPESTASSLSAKPYAALAGRQAVNDALARAGSKAHCRNIGRSGFNRIEWELPPTPPKVSVVVVPHNGSSFIRAVDSIVATSTYPDIEVVVVDDGGYMPPFRQFMAIRSEWFTLVRRHDGASAMTLFNAGAEVASGELICFLGDDMEVLTESWLEEMVGLALQDRMGAVGAKLLYPDLQVEHAGLVAGIGGTVGNIHRKWTNRLGPGYFGRAMLAQHFSAVSGRAILVRREAFEEVGGFDEVNLRGAYGDVDLCFRLRESGWRVGWTPHAELIRHVDSSNPRQLEAVDELASDRLYLQRRWRSLLANDPAYNPNLSLAHETFPLAWPPRIGFLEQTVSS
jgi:O-antigen biosynthesis protein